MSVLELNFQVVFYNDLFQTMMSISDHQVCTFRSVRFNIKFAEGARTLRLRGTFRNTKEEYLEENFKSTCSLPPPPLLNSTPLGNY